jgi:ketosteroid isomerase-like protein
MRHRTVGLTALTYIHAFDASGCAEPQLAALSFSVQDAAAVRENLDTYIGADPVDASEVFFSQFTDDVYWVYADETPRVGINGLGGVEWCHTRSAEIMADRVEGSGDLAYARGTYRLSVDGGEDALIESDGAFLSIHRRQQDGSWRIESLLQPD